MTELCEMALKYGADKCPTIGHMYTPFYYAYFSHIRQSVKKVLEVGIGNKGQARMIPGYIMGPSIRMWRDFFPNAWVYGADVAPESFFVDDRVSTYWCDETKEEDIKKLIMQIGKDIDIVVDDACHSMGNQVFLFQTLMPLLKKDVIYIIEDCRRTRQIRGLFPQYEAFIPKLQKNEDHMCHDGILIFKNK
jgi:hypothetical protein